MIISILPALRNSPSLIVISPIWERRAPMARHTFHLVNIDSTSTVFLITLSNLSYNALFVRSAKMFAWILIPAYEKLDALLDNFADFETKQKFRLRVTKYYLEHDQKLSKFKPERLLLNIAKSEDWIRYFSQKEETLLQLYQALKPHAKTPEDHAQLKRYASGMMECSQKSWKYERELYVAQASIPDGPLRRAYYAWRSNPNWYLHPVLVNGCIELGGCCGRPCGCCAKREFTFDRRQPWGHCTSQCSCCAQARGFEIDPTAPDGGLPVVSYESARPALHKDHHPTSGIQLGKAYFFGVGADERSSAWIW